jgi:hypothetical protein
VKDFELFTLYAGKTELQPSSGWFISVVVCMGGGIRYELLQVVYNIGDDA